MDIDATALVTFMTRQPGAVATAPVLVTGASGFVGSAIAGLLRAEGCRVRVLVRPSSKRTNISAADSVFEGDLRDRSSLAVAMAGVCAICFTPPPIIVFGPDIPAKSPKPISRAPGW